MSEAEKLPWMDLPTGPGWYWFRVNPSQQMRGPTLVRLDQGVLVTHASDSSAEKPCAHFQRSWAGPLAVPEDWFDELQEMRDRQRRGRGWKQREARMQRILRAIGA